MSKSFKWLIPLLFALVLWLPTPVFAEADTTNVGTTNVLTSTDRITVVHTDFRGPDGRGDVGSILGDSGWDIQVVTATISSDFRLKVMAKFECLLGDVDCDGDPRRTSQALKDLGGSDVDFLDAGSTESIAFGFGKTSQKMDFVCGASASKMDNQYRCAPATSDAIWAEPQFAFANQVEVPWLYSFGIISNVAYVEFNLRDAYTTLPTSVSFAVYSGSQQDSTIGEDFSPNTVQSGGAITLPVPAILGDRVWKDDNYNGIQDQHELGVPGWQVELWQKKICGAVEDKLVATTNTIDDGRYQFLVQPGAYALKFWELSWQPFTKRDVGVDTLDSDVGQDGWSNCVNPQAGTTDLTIDAGIWEPNSLGDRCWLDINANGLQDSQEPNIKGCQIDLRTPEGAPISSKLTVSGTYSFIVPDGTYCLFAKLPEGSQFTSFTYPSMGDDYERDSNVERTTGRLGCYTVALGQNRDDIDVGILPQPVDVWIYKSSSPTTVKSGDEITVTLTGGNNGPGTAMNTVFTDTLPVELELLDMPFDDCAFVGREMTCPIGNLAANGLFTLTYHVRAGQVLSDTLVTNEIEIKSDIKDTDFGNDNANSDVLISLNEIPESHKLFMPLCQNGNGPPPADPCVAYRQLPVEVYYQKPVTWTQNSLGEWEAVGVYTTTKKFTLVDGETRTVADVSFVQGYKTCLRNLSTIPWYVKIYGSATSYLPSTNNEVCYDPKPGDAALLKKFNVTWGKGDLSHYDGRPESCQFVAGIDIDVDP